MHDLLNAAQWTIASNLPEMDVAAYQAWIDAADALVASDAPLIADKLAGLGQAARLSIVIADRDDDQALAATFDSLARQIGKAFQVVVAAKAARAASVERLAANAKASCLVVTVEDPGGALDDEAHAARLADGDFIAFLGAGDRLAPEAVAEFVFAVRLQPDVQVIYVDEDWVDGAGRRRAPWFKPPWDPDRQFASDMLSRFTAIRRDVFDAVGGLPAQLGLGAHYEMHWKAAEAAGAARIAHVPSVLHHRLIPQFCYEDAAAAEAYAAASRAVAQRAALRREGARVEVSPAPLAPSLNRIHWPLPDPLPLVSVLVPTRDRADLLQTCLEGVLHRTDYPELEVLVLDNGSVEAATLMLFERLRADPRVRILPMPGPFNYSRLNNDGARQASGEILVLMNNDIEVIKPDWLKEMVAQASRPDIGCVGAKLLYGDRRVQHAGVTMAMHLGCAHIGRLRSRSDPGEHGMLAVARRYSAVTAACLAIRRSLYAEVGGLDAQALQIGYNDVDLCLKVNDHGYGVLFSPFAELYHLESVSRGHNDTPAKRRQDHVEQSALIARWTDVFISDQLQNPNIYFRWDGGPFLRHGHRQGPWRDH